MKKISKAQQFAQKMSSHNSVKTPAHLVIIARAGTGKTTTLVEGLKKMKGMESRITPSEQQAAIWAAMEQSRTAQTICFAAFNSSIAEELISRVPQGCDAMTMHKMGYRSVNKVFGFCPVEKHRVQNIISEILGKDIRDIRRDDPTLLAATEQLVGLVKQNLAEITPESLASLASHYEIEMNGSSARIFELVPKIIKRCKDVTKDRVIDFNDMIWLPIALNLPMFRYDLLLVDEAQDLNRCQQALALKAGKRLILCGDPCQAIYGFAGADAGSMPRMQQILSETPEGCETLYLTYTRRCGKAIVKEANAIVPDFHAYEGNGEGRVSSMLYPYTGSEGQNVRRVEVEKSYMPHVNCGDMVLCRTNAPLVSQCFRFLQQGRKANILGRDIAAGLISLVKKLGGYNPKTNGYSATLPQMLTALESWLESEINKEQAKKNPSETKIIGLTDRADCIQMFASEAKVVADVVAKIDNVFSANPDAKGITLSSVHKSKGLESKRVFLLRPKNASMPHPMAKSDWQIGQEYNLLYVAITRAIEELVFVS